MFRGLVRLHDRHDLTVDYGIALLLDALLQLLVRGRSVWNLLSYTFWNQVYAQSLTSKLHVQGNPLIITIEGWCHRKVFKQNLNIWLAKSS